MNQFRILSTDSSFSTPSLGETFDFVPLDTGYSLCDDLDLVYSNVLKVVLFAYINEPRFRRKWKRVGSNVNSQRLRVKGASHDNGSNRLSTWFSHDPSDDEDEDDNNRSSIGGSSYNKESMKQVLQALEQKLTRIAMNQDIISDSMLRRSLLKFYNDVFLDSQFKQTLGTMTKPEDLIILFVKSANKELTKLETKDPKSDLFVQMSRFINILIDLSRDTKMGPTYVKRLNAYKNSLKQGDNNKRSPSPINGNVMTSKDEESKLVDDTLQPTFRLSEITHSKILTTIFGVDELKLQRDVIRLSLSVKNDLYLHELSQYEQAIMKDEAELKPIDFGTMDQYSDWKDHQLKHLSELKDKVKHGFSGHNESGKNITKDMQLIPNDPRLIFQTLVNLILKHDFVRQERDNEASISLDSKFLLSRCLRYWLIDYGSAVFVNAVSGCLHLIRNLDFPEGMKMTQYVFGFMETRLSVEAPEHTDPLGWNKKDQDQWSTNQVTIFLWLTDEVYRCIECMFSSKTRDTKLKSVISTYHALVEHDSVLIERDFQKSDMYKKQIHKLKKKTFLTIEQRYISLIRHVPTDSEISIKHLHGLCESILDDIALIETKYKPLTNLSSRHKFVGIIIHTYFSALFRDLKILMQRIKKYNKPIDTDALDTYKLLNELRWKNYEESGSISSEGSILEPIFYKYLLSFCENTGDVVKQGCERIIIHETWEPMDKEADQWYSRSAYDISRLISDTLRLVEQLQWNDLAQLGTAYSVVLGKISECVLHYARCMEDIVREDLCISENDEQNGQGQGMGHRLGNDVSIFKDMKSAIQSSKLWNNQWKQQLQGKRRRSNVDAVDAASAASASDTESATTTTTATAATGYVISMRSCVCLNNMASILNMIDEVEKSFQLNQLSEEVRAHVTDDNNKKIKSEIKGQLWSIVPIAAEGAPCVGGKDNQSPRYSLSIVDTAKRHEIYRTLVGGFPEWWEDEELDLELEPQERMSLSLVLWQEKQEAGANRQRRHRRQRKYNSGTGTRTSETQGTGGNGGGGNGSGVPVGRCYLDLDMPRDMLKSRKNESGLEKSLVLPLDTQGRIHVRVCLEVERAEPDCIVGKTRRIVARILTQSLKQVTNRFEPCINDSFSKKSLSMSLSSSVPGQRPTDDDIYDSLVPLFDHLNENLTVLAQALPTALLHQIMLQVWNKILVAADALLLPPLQLASISSSANSEYNFGSRGNRMSYSGSTRGSSSVWDTAVSGFQKVLQKPGFTGWSSPFSNNSNYNNTVGTSLEVEIVFMWIDILCRDFFHNNGEGPPLDKLKNDQYQQLMLIASLFDNETCELKQTIEEEDQRSVPSLSQSVMVALRILWSRGDHKYVMSQIQSRDRDIRAAVAKLRITSND